MTWLLWLFLSFITPAHAQCNGTFPTNTVCGNFGASTAPPGPSVITSIVIISPTLSGATLTSPTINNGNAQSITINNPTINSATISTATITSATITIPNNIPVLGENFAGNGTVEIERVNTNNFVQIGGPLGGGTAVVMPQQLSLFGATANTLPLDIGGGSAAVTARLNGNNSGAGCGADYRITQAGGVAIALGNIPEIVGGACAVNPGIYTNDSVTSGFVQFYFQSLGTSAAYVDTNGFEGKIGQGIAFPGKFTTLAATSTLNVTSLSTFNAQANFTSSVSLSSSTEVAWNNDAGISRVGAADIAIGNGTQGDRSGGLFAQLYAASFNDKFALDASGTFGLKLAMGSAISWSGTTNYFDTLDTGISRDSSGVIDFGTGTQGTSGATVQMSSFIISGTPKFNVFTTGAGTQTFTNSPCAALTTERWIKVTFSGSTSQFFIPSCS